jgi:NADPH:quinone reductase-like Zn-dependent oxidoreductase
LMQSKTQNGDGPMKAVRLRVPGSLDGLVVGDEPTPTVGPRDVLVRVRASSLNFRDGLVIKGLYPGPLKQQGVPLSDGAGEVVAVGERVQRVKIGDRVAGSCWSHWIGGPFLTEYHSEAIGMTQDGTLAEYLLLDENAVVLLPDYLTYNEAAALPCASVSAWTALTFGSPLAPGQTVLTQGTGGVSLYAVQLAKAFGARVIATTSSDEKAGLLKSLGADDVINYTATPRWDEAVLELTGGQGVDKIVEIGGEATIEQSAACARIGGEIGLVGYVTGFGGGLPPLSIMARSLLLKGVPMGPRSSFEALLAAMAMTEIHPVIDSVFSFDDFRGAYRRLDSGQHVGKIVIEHGN